MKPFGLRLSRIPEFLSVVGGAPASRLGQLLSGVFTVIFRRNSMPMPGTAHFRLRVCLKCPYRMGGAKFYTRTKYNGQRLVRLMKRHPLKCHACGCYIPYKVAATPFLSPCPINKEDATKGWL